MKQFLAINAAIPGIRAILIYSILTALDSRQANSKATLPFDDRVISAEGYSNTSIQLQSKDGAICSPSTLFSLGKSIIRRSLGSRRLSMNNKQRAWFLRHSKIWPFFNA